MTNTSPACSEERVSDRIPNTLKEAMDLHQVVHWKTASDEKTVSLEKLGVFELVPITSVPARHKLVGTRWVLKIKADNTYKGRLVAQGFSKVLGVDCGGTFAPVRRLYGIRMMLTIAAELDYEVHVLDVHTVFFNADVKENVYINMTPGYNTNSKAGVPLIMKIKKRFYGLRQSSKNWFGTMDAELTIIGFRLLKSDPCVHIYEDESGVVILTLYVDDILFLSASETLLHNLTKQLITGSRCSTWTTCRESSA